MGGAQFAVKLPQQVHEVVVRAEPVHERAVAGVHRVPVLPGHVFRPEEVALEPPGLIEGLARIAERVELHADAAEVDLDQLPGFLVPLGVGGRDADLLVLQDHDLLAVAGEPVAVQGVHDGGGFAPGQVEADEAGRRVFVLEAGAAFAGDTGEFAVEPEQGAGSGGEAGVVALRHRHADDTVGQAFGVDPDRRNLARLLPAPSAALPVPASAGVL